MSLSSYFDAFDGKKFFLDQSCTLIKSISEGEHEDNENKAHRVT